MFTWLGNELVHIIGLLDSISSFGYKVLIPKPPWYALRVTVQRLNRDSWRGEQWDVPSKWDTDAAPQFVICQLYCGLPFLSQQSLCLIGPSLWTSLANRGLGGMSHHEQLETGWESEWLLYFSWL